MLFILARNDHPCGLIFVINKSISNEIGTKLVIEIEKIDGMNPMLFFNFDDSSKFIRLVIRIFYVHIAFYRSIVLLHSFRAMSSCTKR